MTSDTIPLWSVIAFILILTAAALTSAVERALSSVNRSIIRDLAEDGHRRAKRLLPIIEDPGSYMLALRSLLMLLYTSACIIAVYLFRGLIMQGLLRIGMEDGSAAQILSVCILILILAIVLYSMTELLPRRVAVLHEEGIALRFCGWAGFFMTVMKPMTVLCSGLVNLFLRLFRQKIEIDYREYSEEDIVDMLEAGQEQGELKEEGKKMITGVLAFDDLLAYEVMTPRTDVFAININDPADEYIDELMEL